MCRDNPLITKPVKTHIDTPIRFSIRQRTIYSPHDLWPRLRAVSKRLQHLPLQLTLTERLGRPLGERERLWVMPSLAQKGVHMLDTWRTFAKTLGPNIKQGIADRGLCDAA